MAYVSVSISVSIYTHILNILKLRTEEEEEEEKEEGEGAEEGEEGEEKKEERGGGREELLAVISTYPLAMHPVSPRLVWVGLWAKGEGAGLHPGRYQCELRQGRLLLLLG